MEVTMTTVAGEQQAVRRALHKGWWLFLVTGALWVLVSFVVLALDPGSVRAVSYLVAFVVILAGINEIAAIGFVDSWKWAHGLLGALFIVAGVAALFSPFQTFGILALLIGWYLLFKGLGSVVLSLMARHETHLWGLVLASGIIEMLIGLWAIGSPVRSAWLLVLWVGLAALFRGMTEIFLAFRLRNDPELAI
jgi:uncharacterized membrane protein HdeD (DUF308 family)